MEGRTRAGRSGRAPRALWRRSVIAALVTVALASLVILLGYERMRNQADDDAAATVKQAPASDRAGVSAARQRPPAEQRAEAPSR